MVAFRNIVLSAVAVVLVAGACTSIPAIPTIPPINIPGASIPPINFPGTSGGILPPGFTIPPIIIPGLSIPPGSVPCALVTPAEVTQILGSQVTDTGDNSTNCTFTLPNFTALSVQATTDTDLSGIQFLMGSTAQQSTIGGLPALSGTVFGQPAVYVQKGGSQLQILGVLLGSDPATITKLQQIATVALGRMP